MGGGGEDMGGWLRHGEKAKSVNCNALLFRRLRALLNVPTSPVALNDQRAGQHS
jgi:hypothetical protein